MPSKTSHQPGTVRIIGGQWRSRKIQFTEVEGLRPTPDRVRETLFNWLQPVIVEANCLDLFAGSGALGFEALSRGASHCMFFDKHTQCISDINSNLQKLSVGNGETVRGDALQLLKQQPEVGKRFNVVFIDPPYTMNCALSCCQMLVEHQWLADKSYIYIESATPINESDLPEHWQLHRQKKAGNVNYHLAVQNL